MSTDKVQTGIRFNQQLLIKITHVAKANKRSLNAQLEFLAEECVKQYEDQNGNIIITEEQFYKK